MERLREVNSIIETMDDAIRGEAFAILRPYIARKPTTGDVESAADDALATTESVTPAPDTSSAEAFVRSLDITKPSEFAKAIGAWWFTEYGSAPITRGNIESIAHEIGVTIPHRPDNTLRGMKNDAGKPVYRKTGRGAFIPTRPHGELYFQSQYGVTKGRKQPPQTDDS